MPLPSGYGGGRGGGRGGYWGQDGGGRDGGRGGGGYRDRGGFGGPPPRGGDGRWGGGGNDRWGGGSSGGGRWSNDSMGGGGWGGGGRDRDRGYGGGGGRDSRPPPSGSNDDWTVPTPRSERMEMELFGGGHAPSGINFDRYEDIPVEATGSDVPQGIDDFTQIQLTEIIRNNIELASYTKPTPVQKNAIPVILARR